MSVRRQGRQLINSRFAVARHSKRLRDQAVELRHGLARRFARFGNESVG